MLTRPDPRVDEGVGDVDDQVDEDEDDRDEQNSALQDGVVPAPDRIDEPGAHPGKGEDRLGEHCSRQEQAGLEPDDGDDRQHRVPQHMPRVDLTRRKPLGAGDPDVVLVLHVENGCAGDARDDRERDRAERDRRQDQMLDDVPEDRESPVHSESIK